MLVSKMRRSKLEVYLDILKAVSETGKPTKIGNIANLSWNKTRKYLEFLEINGFIRGSREGKRIEYKITEKGFEVLKILQKIKDALTPKAQAPKLQSKL